MNERIRHNLRSWRKFKGLSLLDMSKVLNIPYAGYVALEQGIANIKAYHILKLVESFGDEFSNAIWNQEPYSFEKRILRDYTLKEAKKLLITNICAKYKASQRTASRALHNIKSMNDESV